MDFIVTKATSEDKDRIDDFVHDHFLPDMPLIRAFGLENLPPPPRTPSSDKPPEHAQDFTLLALDSQGNMVGLAINRVNPTFHIDQETPPQVKKAKASFLQRHLQLIEDQIKIKKSRMVEMVELMQWTEERAELNKLPERTIELRVLSVRSDWRQRGVAKQLARESMREARDQGFQAMRVCCTSEFTARVARSLDWREHYKVAYRDYPELSGRDVQLNPTSPHDHLYYYVTDL